MPWRSFEEKEQAKLAVKEAVAQHALGGGITYLEGFPVCAVGHIHARLVGEPCWPTTAVAGSQFGLTVEESEYLADANDQLVVEYEGCVTDPEPLLAVIDQIPVG